MPKKEENREKIGWIMIFLGFAIFGIFLISKLGGQPTGLTVYNRGTITTESLDVIVGDEVRYTGVSGPTSCVDPQCTGFWDGPIWVIPADGADPSCLCQVTDGIFTHDVTLNIQTTRSAGTEEALTSPDDPDTNEYASLPTGGIDGTVVG